MTGYYPGELVSFMAGYRMKGISLLSFIRIVYNGFGVAILLSELLSGDRFRYREKTPIVREICSVSNGRRCNTEVDFFFLFRDLVSVISSRDTYMIL
ncbi:MAG: hypothetical protein JXA44_02550 [Methanospirillaceae archaeon]|nr:hypothetical protein [Methanospirillaceae archaeon]